MLTHEEYLRQRARRWGDANPERMDVPHWVDMVRSGETAYAADVRYLGERDWDLAEPGWCFDRFGMTRTRLPDGRIVCVAGEHEDHYDPDFCIYNDAILIEPGGGVAIYGYPPDVFPPTDFHTATRVGEDLFLIGALGYAKQRHYGQTQVYALDLLTLAVRPVATQGDGPGWLFKHHARLLPGGHQIRIGGGTLVTQVGEKEENSPNERVHELDLHTMRWSVVEGPWVAWPEEKLELPQGWAAIPWEKAAHFADSVGRSVGPDHPLFAHDCVPVAECADAVQLRSPADPFELVVFEGPTWTGRSEEPLRIERFRGVPAWLEAAKERGAWWWRGARGRS